MMTHAKDFLNLFWVTAPVYRRMIIFEFLRSRGS